MFGARVCLVGDEDCFVRVGEEGQMAGGSIVHIEVAWGEYLLFLAYVVARWSSRVLTGLFIGWGVGSSKV